MDGKVAVEHQADRLHQTQADQRRAPAPGDQQRNQPARGQEAQHIQTDRFIGQIGRQLAVKHQANDGKKSQCHRTHAPRETFSGRRKGPKRLIGQINQHEAEQK